MVTRAYSTSFSLGIYFLDHRLREAVYAVYGYVRVADEIVDSFDGYDKRSLLSKFRQETYEAIEKQISVNPVLHSFQQAVNQYHIDVQLIDDFLKSMEMDLEKVVYTPQNYQEYIFGSAEVVGLMCLHIFTEGNLTLYQELKPYAMKLGAAFQKVNFLRDLKDDYLTLGRVYFPQVDLSRFTCVEKKQIEAEIENDFRVAITGIRRLPSTARTGVYLAYVYYQSLFDKIKKLPPQRLMTERVRINNRKKLTLLINSLIQQKMNLL
jgi:phytoene/squalene synthetase